MTDADLRLYVSATEYGTIGNPISFGAVTAGQITNHPLNPFYLWNDKGGSLGSLPAQDVEAQVLDMWLQDENMGTSDGSPSQTFTCSVIPVVDDVTNLIFKVGTEVWTRVGSLVGLPNTAKVYTFNVTTGVVTFGNGVTGAIPGNGLVIYGTYMPDTVTYGKPIYENIYLEIKSSGATSNSVAVVDELIPSSATTLVVVSHTAVLSVSGVWLLTDPTHAGTNYYTGGSFDANTGFLTLGTALPSANTAVLVNYSYTIVDDAESTYIPIGKNAAHMFAKPIPQNNAKLIYLRLNVPATAIPTGGNVSFRLRFRYKQ